MAETEKALEALWRKVTAKPLWLPPHLLRYLRLRQNVNLTPIRPQTVRVTAPPGFGPNCRACTDNCCIGKTNTVSLRLLDVARLVDMGRDDLISTEKPTFAAEELTPARAQLVGSAAYRALPVLKKDASWRCQALGQGNRCTIYPRWPLSCARFPYSLDQEDNEIFYSQRCPSQRELPRDEQPRLKVMVDAAIASYNERIRDCVLIEYAPQELDRIGVGRFLSR